MVHSPGQLYIAGSLPPEKSGPKATFQAAPPWHNLYFDIGSQYRVRSPSFPVHLVRHGNSYSQLLLYFLSALSSAQTTYLLKDFP